MGLEASTACVLLAPPFEWIYSTTDEILLSKPGGVVNLFLYRIIFVGFLLWGWPASGEVAAVVAGGGPKSP